MRHHALSKLAALALVLAVTTPVVTAADVRLSGIGIRKCSEWNAWKDSNNGEARATMLEWAQGFIAGHNIYARIGRDMAPSVVADTKILVTLIDSYCQRNPTQRIVNGIIEINQSLGGAKVDMMPKTTQPTPPRPDDKTARES